MDGYGEVATLAHRTHERIGSVLAGSAFGFIVTVAQIGAMVFPILMGTVMDITDQYWPGFLLLAVLFAVAAALAALVKETGLRVNKAASPSP